MKNIKIGGLLAHLLFGVFGFHCDVFDCVGWTLASKLTWKQARQAQKLATDVISDN